MPNCSVTVTPHQNAKTSRTAAFTLIEMSIVLVIIGLIVGGVLVGQDLIRAAGIRAQIAQIDKYNQAVNTFREKTGYLPGDIPNPYAAQFGFATRGVVAGEGDGNGLLQGPNSSCVNLGPPCGSANIITGELAQFWIDLSTVGLIDGGFNQSGLITGGICSTNILSQCFPKAKIGGDSSYVYVWSGGWQEFANSNGDPGDSNNYFEIAWIWRQMNLTASALPSLSVAQAYTIDTKIDDGLPQYGRVLALHASGTDGGWAANSPTKSTMGVSAVGDYNSTTGGPVLVNGDHYHPVVCTGHTDQTLAVTHESQRTGV